MRFRSTLAALLAAAVWMATGLADAQEKTPVKQDVPENVYKGELVSYPGAWSFQLGRACIILVSDKEFEALEDPDKVLNLTLTFQKEEASLRQVCERAKAAGQRTLIIAFDHFFSQYRPGQSGPRNLMPDMDEYVQRIAKIGRFAEKYGLGLELSLLTPLEIGKAYTRATGEQGLWMHYREGRRDPATGKYSVQLWQQRIWVNNKGPFKIADAGVRVFAFHEAPISGTPYRAVDPKGIREITDTASVELMEKEAEGKSAVQIRVFGKGRTDVGGLERVLVVQQYKTPEMDYLSPKALPYLKKLIDKYADAGVKLNALYSDEMHIQQDWNYFGHHDHGQFAMRYVSPGLSRAFAQKYGAEYVDLAKYMVYFAYGQEDQANDLSAAERVSHVMGAAPEDARRTELFRSRYYRLLQDGVVELFAAAKRHAEARMGHTLESRAHATWAESPTIDNWRAYGENMYSQAYEYTPNFVWSNTVHQAASACHDYFKWGEFLTGNGNDHAECGWLDRNYVGLALACSTGVINEVPYSYGAHWGMPNAINARRMDLVNVYGAAGSPLFGMVQEMQHRDVSVLMLYPLDLVATEERFGSWMTQYGYANLITQAKLVELGKVEGGAIVLAGRRFTTLMAQFEPLPSAKLLAMMGALARAGGRVIWCGPPPTLTAEGEPASAIWSELFGATTKPGHNLGVIAPGRQVAFEGALKQVAPQTILTDMLVDRIYPLEPAAGSEPVARCRGRIIGVRRTLPGGGQCVALGFRPRDDQSASLGREERTLYDILSALGAYDGKGNTEALSRTTPYLFCRFPNGAVAAAPHLRTVEEQWEGGFARNEERDKVAMAGITLPDDTLELSNADVNGHTVTYKGKGSMCFRVDGAGNLIAFAGSLANSITVDGKTSVYADGPTGQLAWAPVPEARRVPGGAVMQAMVYWQGVVRIPDIGLPANVKVYAEGTGPGSRGAEVKCDRSAGALAITVGPEAVGRWLYVTPAP